MDIRDVVKTDKYAICCRNKEEMLWLEKQLQQLEIQWTSRLPFALTGSCWTNLRDDGNCAFACNEIFDDVGRHIVMSFARADYYHSSGDKPRVIIEAADLMPSYNIVELLDLL